MKHSELTEALAVTFGSAYGTALLHDLTLPALAHARPASALEAGVSPRAVWEAICLEMDLPEEARFPHRAERRGR